MLSVIDEKSIPVEILLKIGVDGVPMSKSGKSQLWPLTGLISNLEFQSLSYRLVAGGIKTFRR